MQPPPGPRSAYTGTPAVLSALMSRYTVRSETSSRRARSAAVMRPRLCSNSSNESKRSARTAHLRESGIAGSIGRNPDRRCQVDAATLIQVMHNRRVTGRGELEVIFNAFWVVVRHSAGMKLSEYARQAGVTYQTAYQWWRAGQLDVSQLPTGPIIVHEPQTAATYAVLDARVSSAEEQADVT